MSSPVSLPEEALALLPTPDEAPRCAPFAAGLGADPGGTAIAAQLIVAVDTPLPWPKPVFEHPLLEGLTSTFEAAVGPARILAAQPPSDTQRGIRVHTWWYDGDTHVARHCVADHDELVQLINELRAGAPDESSFIEAAPPGQLPLRALLVCTQGSHDVCCGTDGTRFANEVRASRPDLAVFRVSHTGGHRFAPTALSMPDGRMWAWLRPDEVEHLITESGEPADVIDRCRGWWGAKGPAQVAERAVFALEGWSWNHTARTVELVEGATGRYTYRVSGGGRSWEIVVAEGRTIPTIACRADGGLPAKRATEYVIESVSPAG